MSKSIMMNHIDFTLKINMKFVKFQITKSSHANVDFGPTKATADLVVQCSTAFIQLFPFG